MLKALLLAFNIFSLKSRKLHFLGIIFLAEEQHSEIMCFSIIFKYGFGNLTKKRLHTGEIFPSHETTLKWTVSDH